MGLHAAKQSAQETGLEQSGSSSCVMVTMIHACGIKPTVSVSCVALLWHACAAELGQGGGQVVG